MAQYDVDLVVIGGGPGGYPAAIHAAKMGAKVVCVDFDSAGGTCLNWGCIPTKTMIGSVAALEQARHGADFGLILGEVGYDFDKLMARKDKVVATLVGGVEFLFKKNKVRFLKGKAKLADSHTVEVALEDGKTERVTAASIILATGSVVAPLPSAVQVIGGDSSDADVFIDNREVRKRKAAGTLGKTTLWTSNEAVSAPEVPKRLVVLGAGAVGTEFAYTYNGLGSQVTLIEFMPNIVPPADPDLSKELHSLLTKAGITILTSTKVVAIDVPGRKVKYVSEKGDGELEFDKMLIGVGRRAYTDGLGLENAGVNFDGRKIVVDEYMRTSVPHIYAIGDAAGGGLAHVATREGEVAGENALGHETKMDYTAVPYCVYTEPEMAWTGLTEQQARDKGFDVQVGKFTFKSLGKALAINENVGLVKIVTDAKYGEILGVHIVGPHATDLIHEACVSIKLESTIEELMHTIHAHPTLAEAIMEAALDVKGESVNK
jgi:dihydrolipoamide dehydrogenase